VPVASEDQGGRERGPPSCRCARYQTTDAPTTRRAIRAALVIAPRGKYDPRLPPLGKEKNPATEPKKVWPAPVRTMRATRHAGQRGHTTQRFEG
jgi:hypothetical protein